MMRKHLVIFAAVILFAACDKYDDGNHRCNTEIADFLYGIEYDDYDFKACKDYFDKKYIPSGLCSEVRRGNFIGRNLDWNINNNASAIIKVNHTDEHYASIGVVGCFPEFSNDVARSGRYDPVYKYLPFKTEDGINECGLYVGFNVVPTGETSFDVESWRPHEYGLGAAHTNPSANTTCAVNYLVRILLDNASSVEEAKQIIASIDWTDPKDYPGKGETQSFHWLISDAQHSVVLEFIDNKACYIETSSVSEPGFATIMTNFNNCLKQADIMQIYGIGYERYDILRDNYKNYEKYPDNFKGMQDLMAQVWFTKAYTTPLDSKDLWLTEQSNEIYPAKYLYKNPDVMKDPAVRAIFEIERALFNDTSTWYTDECLVWFSTHTSVYDLADKKMHVLVHEGLSGMDSFYEASFDSSFAKPLSR